MPSAMYAAPTVNSVTISSLLLNWLPAAVDTVYSNNSLSNFGYSIRLQVDNSLVITTLRANTLSTGTSLSVYGLPAYSTYTFSVAATNDVGMGDWSAWSVPVTLLPYVNSSDVSNIVSSNALPTLAVGGLNDDVYL